MRFDKLSALSPGRLKIVPLTLLLVSLTSPPSAFSASVDYFPFDQANSWRFSGVDSGVDENNIPYTKTYANSMLITGTKLVGTVNTTVFYESNPANSGEADEIYLLKNAVGITNYGSASDAGLTGLSGQLTPYLELRFPLVAGDSFVQLDKRGLDMGMDLDGDGSNETFNARSVLTVAGFESVSVPAGSFTDCVKLVRQMNLTIILSSSGQQVSGVDSGTMWLAPGIGPVKKNESLKITISNKTVTETVTEQLTEYLVNGQGPGLSNGPLAFANQPTNLTVRNGSLFWNDASVGTVRQSTKGGRVIPLTVSLGDPIGLAARGGDLFWIEERGGFAASGCAGQGVVRVLKKLAADGSTVTELATGDACSGGTTDLVVDDTSVYWVNSLSSPNIYSIRKVPLSGGPAVTMVSSFKQIVGLTVDPDHIYWEEEGMGPITLPDGPEGSTVSRIAKGGGTPQLLVNGALNGLITPPLDPNALPGSWFPRGGIAVLGGELFFSDTNFNGRYRLFKVPVTGGSLVELTAETTSDSSNYIRRLAAADSSVVWLDSNGVKILPATGGVPQTLSTISLQPLDLLLAGGRVYWTETSGPVHGETGTLKTVPMAGGTVETLVQGGDAPRRLAASENQLYWSEGGPIGQIEGFARIARIPLDGGLPVTVLLRVGSGPIAVDDSNLYVGNGFRIYKLPLGSEPPVTLVRGDDTIHSLTSDGSFVYWLEGPLATVRRVSIGGGEAITLFSSAISPLTGPAGPIRVSGDYVYWMSHYTAISRIPVVGGPVQIIVSNDLTFLSDFVTDGVNVYYSEQDSGDIKRVPVTGGSSVTLANGLRWSYNVLALDSRYLYWIDQVHLGKVPLTGGSPIYLVTGGLNSDPFVTASVAVEGASLYWTETATGAVMKLTLAAGDCNGDSSVTIAEVQTAINMFLSVQSVERCVDTSGDGIVSIAEVQKVINGFLGL